MGDEAVPPDAPEPPGPVALPIDGVLDLHTFAPREVGRLVPAWLAECRAQGILEVRIIHGKGTGVLRERVHRILERDAAVLGYHLAGEDGGGWGATLATLAPA